MLGPSTFLLLPLGVEEVVASVEETGGGVSRICARARVSAGQAELREGTHLVVAEPDLAVGNGKVENVVDERLCPPRRLRHRKDLFARQIGRAHV